jgi:hypothetical protein
VASRIRPFFLLGDRCSPLGRRSALALGSMATLLSWLALATVASSPAAAHVENAEGISCKPATETCYGLQPRDAVSVLDGAVTGEFHNPSGDPVLPATDTYAIYWDPTNGYHGNWQRIVNLFLQGLGAGSGSLASVFAVDTQYTDRANQHALYESTFRGAYTDTNSYPKTGDCTDPSPLHAGRAIVCLTDKQMREQVQTFIAQHLLPKGMGAVYYLLTPPGVTVCLDAGGATGHCSDHTGTIEEETTSYKNSFCSYHSDINPDGAAEGDANTILFAVVPWIAGGLGDYHLSEADQTPAYDCQDGGFDPSSEPTEEHEHPKVDTKEEDEKRLAAEKKENEELTTYEEQFNKGTIIEPELEAKKTELRQKRSIREAEEKIEREKREKLEGPRAQEPNQNGLGEDGSYDAGLADVIVSQIGAEQQNIVTDPLLNAWQDEAGNESTDECRDFFALTLGGNSTAVSETLAGTLFNQTLGGYDSYLNDAYNLAARKMDYPGVPCLTGVNLAPEFTSPNPVNSGDIVGFDGMESDITLNAGVKFSAQDKEELTYPTFTWNFGDGSPEVSGYAPGAPSVNSPGAEPCEAPWLSPCAASAFHSYQYGGTYNVTLTVKDVGGHTASTTQSVVVNGPPPPSPEPGPSPGPAPSSAATTNGGSGSGSSSGSPTAKPQLAAPVAAQAIASSSLAKTVKKGLIVKYQVNEQVTGSFNVLLAASIAKRLGLHLPLATGLPAGTPPQEIVGKALLITTKGGRGTIKIEFGKVTGARLRKLGKVSLMLQLNLRNASGGTATVLSKITLH